MSVYRLILPACLLACFSNANVDAALLDRGGGMLYDDVLNITWTQQAGDGVQRTWADAKLWAANLAFGGFNDWRLPYASVADGSGGTNTTLNAGQACSGAIGADEIACRNSELAYMFYYNLGGAFGTPLLGTQSASDGTEIDDIQRLYWADTLFDSSNAWYLNFGNGEQNRDDLVREWWTWAVRDGDVRAAAAPEPSTVALLAMGVAGLLIRRRKRLGRSKAPTFGVSAR